MSLPDPPIVNAAGHIGAHTSLHEDYNTRAGSAMPAAVDTAALAADKAVQRIVVGPTRFNVKSDEFSGGAKGDNVTHDSAAVQACVNHIIATANGGILCYPPGQYIHDVPVTWAHSNVHVEGAGTSITTIVAPPTDLAFDIGDGVSIYHYINIDGLTMTRPVAGGAGILRLRKIDQWLLRHATLAGGTFNLQLSACIAGHLLSSQISSHTLYGVQHDNCDQIEMIGNTFETNAGGTTKHVYVQSGNKAIDYVGNVFSTATYALYSDGGPSNACTFDDNNVENCPNGMLLGPVSNPASSGWAIGGNTMVGTGAAGDGIRVYGSRHAIVGNAISGFLTNSIVENNAGGGVGPNVIEANALDIAPSIAAPSTICRGNLPPFVPTVNSASTIAIPGCEMATISGTTNIDTITATGQAGRILVLKFNGALTVGDGSGNLKLAGNLVTAADTMLVLACDGTNWREMSRSVN